jgi:putative tryptophan/tyrosine transport system substrate-binding protein
VSVTRSLIPSLIARFAHPGGRVTGLTPDVELLIGKLAELLLDATPGVTKIGYLSNSSMERYAQHVRTIAAARNVELGIAYANNVDKIIGALVQLTHDKAQAILVPSDPVLDSAKKLIVAFAMNRRLPVVFGASGGAVAGGLASHGVNTAESYRRAAGYVDKILKGVDARDLPIAFAQAETVINLKTAKALGLVIPLPLLDRADELIN